MGGCTPSVHMGSKCLDLIDPDTPMFRNGTAYQPAHTSTNTTQTSQPLKQQSTLNIENRTANDLDKKIKDVRKVRGDVIDLLQKLDKRRSKLQCILNIDEDMLKENGIDVQKMQDVLKQTELDILQLNTQFDNLEKNIQNGMIIQLISRILDFKRVHADQVKLWEDDIFRGKLFLDQVKSSFKPMGFRDIYGLKEIPMLDDKTKIEFENMDDGHRELSPTYIKVLVDAISKNIRDHGKKHNDSAKGYINGELYDHILLIRITLQYIACQHSRRMEASYVGAYQAIENLLAMYNFKNKTDLMMKKSVDDMISSFQSLL